MEAVATTEDVVHPHAMDPRMAMCIKAMLGVFAVLIYIGFITLMFWRFGTWFDIFLPVVMLTPNLVWGLWMIYKMPVSTNCTQGSDATDLSTKLLASEKYGN
ncbi:hypothetical protein BS78_06G058100 [Paspalum vaginatum]|nr:hypothetical protein BS78_06G058100 [Paspalum vaginatum]